MGDPSGCDNLAGDKARSPICLLNSGRPKSVDMHASISSTFTETLRFSLISSTSDFPSFPETLKRSRVALFARLSCIFPRFLTSWIRCALFWDFNPRADRSKPTDVFDYTDSTRYRIRCIKALIIGDFLRDGFKHLRPEQFSASKEASEIGRRARDMADACLDYIQLANLSVSNGADRGQFADEVYRMERAAEQVFDLSNMATRDVVKAVWSIQKSLD